MNKISISVLTPTYNRAHVLNRVYQSLLRQTVRNFEWVVVDDGSADETPTLLERWQGEADFLVTWYRYSNNRGKSAAVNSGGRLVSGDYTVILDSDDAFLDDAMETIEHYRNKLDIDSTLSAYAMVFRCVDDLGNLVGKPFPFVEPKLISTSEAVYRLGIHSDMCMVFKTETLKMEPFLELTKSEHGPEIITHSRMVKQFKAFYIDFPIRRYFLNDSIERLTDGFSSTTKWPRGNYLNFLCMLNEDINYFIDCPRVFLKAARGVAVLGFHLGRSPWHQFRDLTNAKARLLWTAQLPRSLTRYMKDCLRGRKGIKAHPDIFTWSPAAPPKDAVLHRPPPQHNLAVLDVS